MIIIIGPDSTGKTTLATKLSKMYSLRYFHYTRGSDYKDYIGDMCALGWSDAVLDRHALCEYAYSIVMEREFKFSLKEWHNLILTTLIQNPLIVLCNHKPQEHQYPTDQYLPYNRWDKCLLSYADFLTSHHIPFIEYDYTKELTNPDLMIRTSRNLEVDTGWWIPMWTNGWGCIGSTKPKVLLVAERIGPNNTHNIPFETGPTGLMLSDLLYKTKTPLGGFAVTNLVKSWRRDSREPNDEDMRLLGIELDHLNPDKVIFMGSVAKKGYKEAKKRDMPCSEMTHFGYYSHRGDRSIDRYIPFWRQELGIAPLLPL